jgi:hypothetical protein
VGGHVCGKREESEEKHIHHSDISASTHTQTHRHTHTHKHSLLLPFLLRPRGDHQGCVCVCVWELLPQDLSHIGHEWVKEAEAGVKDIDKHAARSWVCVCVCVSVCVSV